ncbi:MAG: hypothetical protein AB1353_08895 [Aquificota bacterium]|jgi:hypothetical protein|nr:hypothetical protein [Aquificaceae bacterium]HAV40289.1 hypothetical protein [Aquificaceae bacterium]HCO38405.1 hypothetical protein [Aquificaceae bacterium]
MEIRRIEGVLFQHATEQFQTIKAQKAGEALRIRVLSVVPDVLLDLSLGSTIRAKVSHWEGSIIGLTLPNGVEIRAENKSSIPLMVGDTVDLMVESTNPFVFRVVGLYRKGQGEELLKLIFEKEDNLLVSINMENFKESVENSGIFYERKLFDLFLGKIKVEDLMKDRKAQITGQVLLLAKDLSDMLGIDFEVSLESIKNLLHIFKEKIQNYEKIIEAFKVLSFENMSHEEYLEFIKDLRNYNSFILALDRGDKAIILKELYRLIKSGKLTEYKSVIEALESLQNLEEPVVKEFLKAMEGGSDKDIKRAYSALENYLKEGQRWIEFYNTKLPQLENLLYRLEFLNSLQWTMLKDGKAFYLPIYYEGGKGGIMFKADKDYTVFFKLNYNVGFLAGLLKRPKKHQSLDIRFLTNMAFLAEKLREGKNRLQEMLLEDGIELKSYLVEVVEEAQVLERVKDSFSQEGFLLIV